MQEQRRQVKRRLKSKFEVFSIFIAIIPMQLTYFFEYIGEPC